MVGVSQLVRASDCGSEGRGFESHHPPHMKRKPNPRFTFFVYLQTHKTKALQDWSALLVTKITVRLQ